MSCTFPDFSEKILGFKKINVDFFIDFFSASLLFLFINGSCWAVKNNSWWDVYYYFWLWYLLLWFNFFFSSSLF